MSRTHRRDTPGSDHHLWLQGVGNRTVAECHREIRLLLAYLAKEVRRGLIQVISFSILTTHFHLLIRSPVGDFPSGMRNALSAYVRRFNLLKDRHGPLFRSRICSKLVDSEAYFYTLVRYIDQNAKDAGLVRDPADYPYGSAWYYVNRARGPLWIEREILEGWAQRGKGLSEYSPDAYRSVFGLPLTEGERRLVVARMSRPGDEDDPLDDLVGAAPSKVLEWLRERNAVADGTRPGIPVATPASLDEALKARSKEVSELVVCPRRRRASAADALNAGLLRGAGGLSHREILLRIPISQSTLTRDLKLHRQLLEENGPYAELAGEVVAEALRRDRPAPR